ncbi:hypothetical protein BGZ72_008195 [Mortierella alpina]|nr:hypothetical protein BGZ72_008195 [Mortierella alpina]
MELNWDEVDRSEDEDMPDLETIINEASIARFSQWTNATKIKTLRLPTSRVGATYPLPLLLLKSDLLDLESCEIPWFRRDSNIKEIEQVVRKHCLNLKHLICPSFRSERQHNGETARAFIRGCSGLRSFTSKHFSDFDPESFETRLFSDHPSVEPRLIIPELVSRHYDTLELRRFWVTEAYGVDHVVGIESPDVGMGNWTCSELRELYLVLNLRPRRGSAFDMLRAQMEEDGELDEELDEVNKEKLVVAMATKRVYTQIGKLEKLEDLMINTDMSLEGTTKTSDYAWNLTVSAGYLGELAGLKSLKRLNLRADFWSTMGQAEVEFMDRNWPLLSEITVDVSLSSLSQLKATSHWQWLRNRRPQLELVCDL